MSAFLRGVQLGNSIYDDVQREELLKKQEARAAQDAQWKAEDRNREQGIRQQWEQLGADLRDGQTPAVPVDDDGNAQPRVAVSPEQLHRRSGALFLSQGRYADAVGALENERASGFRRQDADLGATLAQLSPQEKLERYGRPLLNENMGMRGAIGWDEKTKKYVVTDFDGSGGVDYLTDAEVNDYIMQQHELRTGRTSEGAQRGLKRDERVRGRVRQDVQDQNAAVAAAHTMDHQSAMLQNDRTRLGWQGQDRRRLDAQLELGRRAAGLYEGMVAARGAGPAGQQAAAIYGQQLAGINAQLQALGLPGVGARDRSAQPLNPLQRAQAAKAYADMGYSPAQAQMLVDTNGDMGAVLDGAFAGGGQAGGAPAAAPAAPAAPRRPAAPPMHPDYIASLRERAARGDRAATAELRALDKDRPGGHLQR
ncbi:MAG: hypothetical protein ACK54C_02125 [Betaproteobacteria bacterium]